MAELEYSADAVNVLSDFYRCDLVVYVEGDDDVLFWQTIIKQCGDVEVEVQSVGGASELDSWIERIFNENLQIVAARDADFLTVSGRALSHPRVLYTYGYSIENTLYTPEILQSISRAWTKNNRTTPELCRNWMKALLGATRQLVYFDFANYLHDYSISVVGDNCTRFMDDNDSCVVSKLKVVDFLATVQKHVSVSHFSGARKKLMASEIEAGMFLRGHFLASAVIKFVSSRIREAGKSSKISYDALYANAIQILETAFDSRHPQFDHYHMQISEAFGSV